MKEDDYTHLVATGMLFHSCNGRLCALCQHLIVHISLLPEFVRVGEDNKDMYV